MKRSAGSELFAEKRPPQPSPTFGFFSSLSSSASKDSNPFAGLSFGSASSSGSLFTAAASSAAASDVGFALGAPASTPKPASSEPANPFMGLSLFSAPSSAGNLFTAVSSSLPQSEKNEPSANSFASTSEPSKEGARVAPASTAVSSAVARAKDDGEEADATAEASQAAADPEEPAEEEQEEGAAEDEPTGEEDEEVIFRTEGKLWKLVRDAVPKAEGWRWQERGCGVVHINRHTKTGAARIVMRMKGVLKLLLNTPVFPTTKYEKVGQKSVRFVGVDAELEEAKLEKGEVSLSAFRLNLQSSDQQGKFLAVLRDLAGSAGT